MKFNAIGRSLAIVAFAVLLLVYTAPMVQAQTTTIYGKQGWLEVGDIIQFKGDTGADFPGAPEDCGWDEICEIDKAFYFRQLASVNESLCTYTEMAADTCYAFAVVCCFFFGDCGGDREDLCAENWEYECWETEDDCGRYCLCGCIFEVDSYQSSPGDAGYGCYTISYVCDPDEDCDDSLVYCDVSYRWWM